MRIFKKLEWFISTYKGGYAIGALSLTLYSLGQLIPPWLIGDTADGIVGGSIGLDGLYTRVGLLLGIIMFIYATGFLYRYFFFQSSDLLGRNTRRRIVSQLLTRSNRYFEENSTGSIMGKSTNDVRSLQDMGGFGSMAFFDAIFFPIVLFIVMAVTVDLKLTTVSILPLIGIVFSTRRILNPLYQAFRRIQKAFDRMNEQVLESVSGIRVTRAFNREASESERFNHRAEEYYQANMNQIKYHAIFPFVSRVFPGFSYVLAFIYGSYLVKNGQLSVGGIVTFVLYLNMLIGPMFSMGEFFNIAEEASASMDRIDELLNYKEQMVNRKDAIVYKEPAKIEFRDFSFTYPGDKKPTLRNIQLDIPVGSTLGVVGKIGSGKTTLLKQFLRLYPVEENRILIGDRDIGAYTMESIRGATGYVPQSHILFSKTVEENIAFGSEENKDRVMEAIRLADFEKDLEALPYGIKTLVGEKGVALSGGQRQRVSIARALLKDPEILILDDSLSAVDGKTEESILENLRKTRQGRTNIIAAHRLSAIAGADEIIVLDKGRIVERGKHGDLMANDQWYAQQFRKQELEGLSR